ncbi:MAG: hypothetical protein ABIH86_03005 [Planctomycetota bacterium]
MSTERSQNKKSGKPDGKAKPDPFGPTDIDPFGASDPSDPFSLSGQAAFEIRDISDPTVEIPEPDAKPFHWPDLSIPEMPEPVRQFQLAEPKQQPKPQPPKPSVPDRPKTPVPDRPTPRQPEALKPDTKPKRNPPPPSRNPKPSKKNPSLSDAIEIFRNRRLARQSGEKSSPSHQRQPANKSKTSKK